MKSSQLFARSVTAPLLALGLGLAVVPLAYADPGDVVQNDPAAPVPLPAPVSDDPGAAAVTACSLFADALDSAAVYYGDFADTIEGTERPDYADPYVNTTNTSGRTALRQAAAQAMDAAATPGLPADVANPMRSWSLDATKLLLKMGLHSGGQSLNDTATELNNDATNAQMGCAAAGTHA